MPVTFKVSALLPAGRLCGKTEIPDGWGLLTANVNATEVMPFGFVTITNGLPAIAMALAGIEAVSWVELTNVVLALFRLKLTCEPCTKPLPFTARGNAGPPAVVLVGEMLETVSGTMGGKIVSVTALEVPPPGTPFEGVVTVILAVPWATISDVTISTVISVGPWYDVAWAMPLKFTTELVTKFEPKTNRANWFAPAGMLEGLMDEMMGERADIGNSTEVEAPPPGSGLNTKTTAVPSL